MRYYGLGRFTLFLLLGSLPAPVLFAGDATKPAAIDWIDTHVHLLGGRGDFGGAAKAAVAAMDESAIKICVVMPPPQVSGGARPPFDWKQFKDALQAYQGRFAFLGGGGTLNPMIQENVADKVTDEIKRRFETAADEILSAGAAGFGEIAAHHLSLHDGHPYESVPADHPLLLLLADIAARHDAVIDLHFDLVPEDTNVPERFSEFANPKKFTANRIAFEKLLEHNRSAKIVWAHAGSDPLGNRTPAICRELLTRHSNLYMSLRIATSGRAQGMAGITPPSTAFSNDGEIVPEWLKLFKDFPDRFVIGGDQFILSPQIPGASPAAAFAKGAPVTRERTQKFLAALPADLARKIGTENAQRLYKFNR